MKNSTSASQPPGFSASVLLTGSGGFIGKNIKESYLGEKYNITAPRSFEVNLIDTDAVDEFFKDKTFDVVIHSAVKPTHRNSKDPTNGFYSNMRIFENLERHKDKYEKFINLGSGAIYDVSKNNSDVKEDDLYKNMGTDDHSFCKYVMQKQIDKLDNFVNLNIFGIFGKYEDWQIRFISNAICKAIYGLDITLRQNRRFSYLFIDDLMPILEFFIENNVEHKSYNIVPDEKVELLQLAKIVKKLSNKNINIKVANNGYGLDYTGNNRRLKNAFMDIKFTNIEKSVSLLYNYYDKNKDIIDKQLLLKDK
ncbi:MAG: NAD-dependent epimerase/dehydratase family protein [Candidatus Gastranaerophilales bacterium]|nr:NAD-dependent epimerase/dehydratase family protein [Candidatus Gastranaerophilales bacterium]